MARFLDHVVFTIALVLLVISAAGGPGWTTGAIEAVIASQLDHTAATPLYHVVASVAAYLPVGEPGVRLALLSAVLGAFVILGVIHAARALLPRDRIAGLAGALLLFITPPFRDAAGFAGPATLVACGVVWSVAFAAAHARVASPRHALGALACAGIVLGSAPWLGAPLLVAIALWLARAGAARNVLASGIAVIGALTIALWIGAVGRMPDPAASLGAFVAASGRGAAAIVVGAGLLGIAFATVTRLTGAAWLALVTLLAVGHAIVIDPDATSVLALCAVGAAVVPSAVVRLLPAQRHLVAAIASVPLVGIALVSGPAFAIDDPGDAPARLATDLAADQPPGPGVFVATRFTTWAALDYARVIAGARPDLALVPPLPPERADVIVKNALVANAIAASDRFAFGRLDPKRAYPRGRGFQLLAAEPQTLAEIRPPARYRSTVGGHESVLLALALAQLEAGNGRLDAAAHAAGLVPARFNAADLALLRTAQPEHPPLFGMLPPLGTPPGPWMLQLFGDDLAWVAGLEVPDAGFPPERRLHALWRKLLAGAIKPDDPAIAALGPIAVAATADLVAPPSK